MAETLARMEARFEAMAGVRKLMACCAGSAARFAADPDGPRDVLLSQGGALMLIREAVADRGPG